MSSSGKQVICDTNILIHAFNQNTTTLAALQQIGYDNVVLSAVTVMELIIGVWNKQELHQLHKRIRFYDTIDITPAISALATELVWQFHLSHGLQIPDALIAATSLTYKLPLFTYNLKDFRPIPGIQLYSAIPPS